MAEVCTPSGSDNVQFAHGNLLMTDSRGKVHLTMFCMISSCPMLAHLPPWPLNGLLSPELRYTSGNITHPFPFHQCHSKGIRHDLETAMNGELRGPRGALDGTAIAITT